MGNGVDSKGQGHVDIDEETKRAKWLVRFGAGLLVATIFAWGELKYAAFGTTVQGTQGKIETVESVGRRGRDQSYRVVNYTFTDSAGQARAGYERIADDFAGAPGQPIAITYRGTDRDGPSRLAGVRWGPIAFWLVFFIPTAIYVGSMVVESMQYAKEKKARSTKRPYRF